LKKLLRSSETALPELATERLVLRHTRPAHALQTAAFFARNRVHFQRWDPPAPADFYTVEFWQRNLARAADDFAADRAVRFDLCDATDADGLIIGRVGFSQVVRGAFQSCMLGYQIDAKYEGQGLMTEALRAAIDYMFRVRGLHRVQANHLEENERSARVLERVGFAREGLARDYLFINGRWRDHVLNACVNPEFDAARLVDRESAAPDG
jgi:ribosomal-protein-alanine N-acetyltransferase